MLLSLKQLSYTYAAYIRVCIHGRTLNNVSWTRRAAIGAANNRKTGWCQRTACGSTAEGYASLGWVPWAPPLPFGWGTRSPQGSLPRNARLWLDGRVKTKIGLQRKPPHRLFCGDAYRHSGYSISIPCTGVPGCRNRRAEQQPRTDSVSQSRNDTSKNRRSRPLVRGVQQKMLLKKNQEVFFAVSRKHVTRMHRDGPPVSYEPPLIGVVSLYWGNFSLAQASGSPPDAIENGATQDREKTGTTNHIPSSATGGCIQPVWPPLRSPPQKVFQSNEESESTRKSWFWFRQTTGGGLTYQEG